MTDTGDDGAKKKRRHNRSPRYPAFYLGEAITRAKEFHESAWDMAIGVDSACEVWGLSYSSSTGKRTLSALIQFGLMISEGVGPSRTVRLSRWGLSIVTDMAGVTDEHDAAIRAAALTPQVYHDAWDRWGPRVPADNRIIIPWLIQKLRFNPNSAEGFLTDFRATIEFAKLDKTSPGGQIKDTMGDDLEQRQEPDTTRSRMPEITGSGPRHTDGPRGVMPETQLIQAEPFDLPIPLAGGIATLRMPVPMTLEDYDLLTEALEMSLKLYKGTITKQAQAPPKDDE